MIVQYLEEEGYTASMMTVQDETNVKISTNLKRRSRIRRLQASILGVMAVGDQDGDGEDNCGGTNGNGMVVMMVVVAMGMGMVMMVMALV